VLPKLRAHLTYANVMATIAVFVALGGSSYAAITVTGKNVKNSSLTGKDVKNSSLTTSDVKNRSLLAVDFKAGQLPAGPMGPGGRAGSQGAKGDQGAPGPLVGTLPSGKTLRGGFGAGNWSDAAGRIVEGSISYPFPLASNVTRRLVQKGGTPPAECPGTVGNPQATAGNLCIFVSGSLGVGTVGSYGSADGDVDFRFGGDVFAHTTDAFSTAEFWGTWAVTAP
jgi:hypothetical protein